VATRKKASALGRVTLGRKKRRASVEILTLGLRDCKECRLGEKGRALLLAARAQVGKRRKKVWECLRRCIIGVCVCWRYGRKILKGRWRVLAWVRADADEVPKNQVGVFVEKILKGARVFLHMRPR